MRKTLFEIHDDEIDIEDIMKTIHENIRRRKDAGIYPADKDTGTQMTLPEQKKITEINSDMARDLAYLINNYEIQNNNYYISSHRPFVGKYLVKGRELVHGEVRRYVDPVFWKQGLFNQSTARVTEDLTHRLVAVESFFKRLEERLIEHDSLLHRLEEEKDRQIYEAIRDERSRVKEIIHRSGESIRDETIQVLQQTKAEIEEQIARGNNSIRDETIQVLQQTKAEIEEQIARDNNSIRNETIQVLQQTKAEIEEQIARDNNSIRNETIQVLQQTKAEIEEQIARDNNSIRNETVQVLQQTKAEMTDDIIQMKTEIDTEVITQVRSVIQAMNTDINNRAWLAKVLEDRVLCIRSEEGSIETPVSPSTGTGVNYFVFEETFRGSRQLIKERQKVFIHYYEGCSNVLDIGCGRGEFLEIMREQGIFARGVDLDETMVDYCRSRGLQVEQNDAISYLEQCEDASLDGIFIDQVVEHLEPGYLVRLLELCHQKMKYGFYILAETVNPLSFFSFANFYIDLTHMKPVHPETLRFLFQTAGFREIEVQFSSPLSEGARLQKLPDTEGVHEAEQRRAEIYNRNIDLLNATLYGAQDYTVVGKK